MKEEKSTLLGSQLSTNHRTIALITSSLAAFITSFMASALNIALPIINQEFHSDAILLGWVVTSYVLVIAVLSVPAGRIADILGIKRIFVYGLMIFTATSALAVFSNSIIMLIVCRLIQGIGSAMIICNSIALISAVYSANERGRAFGINVACVYIGMSLGPSLGGILTESFGWRSIFLINIPTCLLVIILVIWKIKGEWSESKGGKFDFAGSIVYGLALVAMIYGFSLLPEISGFVLTLLGISGILFFLKLESRIKSPVLNIGIFRNNKALVFSNLAALINTSTTFALVFLLSLYLQYIKALTPGQAGLIMVAQAATQAILSPFTGRLSDRWEPRIVASIGMALTFVGLLLFSFLTENTPLQQIIIVLIVVGIGLALFSSPNANAVMSSVVPKYYGVTSAILVTIRGIGQTLSMGITVIVMALLIGRVVITPVYYPALLTSTKVIFAIFSVLCFGGILASLYKDKIQQFHHS